MSSGENPVDRDPVRVLVGVAGSVLAVDPERDLARPVRGVEARVPSCLASDPAPGGLAWCGAEDGGVFRSEDGGESWERVGLDDQRVTSIAVAPSDPGTVWVGTEPSAVWQTSDAGARWTRCEGLEDVPSSSEWSFPPRPHTHHVRWIAVDPVEAGRLWVAVEAGALVTTPDGGETWQDRVSGGPHDTHELAVRASDPRHLHAAAGDGYYESRDGGRTWASPRRGLEVGYLRSVAIDPTDPEVVLVSAATHAHAAYVAGRSDGRLYRRRGSGPWEWIVRGWPDEPSTIAPLLTADPIGGALYAADERGIHRSTDTGSSWERIARYPDPIAHLRGLAVVRPAP